MIASFLTKLTDKILILRIRLAKRIPPAKDNQAKYFRLSQKYWSRKGVVFGGTRAIAFYTSNLDTSVKNMIFIDDNTVITEGVLVLVHDYSVQKGLESIGEGDVINPIANIRKVHIGKSCFIGNRAIILPGTEIGDNCIVGAGSVLRGKYPSNSIIVGNPAVVVSNTIEWAKKKLTQLK